MRFHVKVCDHLGRAARRVFDGRRVFIIDGTTVTLAPTPALSKAFPPATNQYGESVWPVAMLNQIPKVTWQKKEGHDRGVAPRLAMK